MAISPVETKLLSEYGEFTGEFQIDSGEELGLTKHQRSALQSGRLAKNVQAIIQVIQIQKIQKLMQNLGVMLCVIDRMHELCSSVFYFL
ncbi:hypothetical protein QQ045_012429 [Rhodiola kirilowii]